MSNAFLHKQETNCFGKEKETKEENRKEKGESPCGTFAPNMNFATFTNLLVNKNRQKKGKIRKGM
jgi:hypothetical protein